MENKMVRAGIVGISGFAGKVLFDILSRHPRVRVTYVAANSTTGRVDSIWPEFTNRTDLVCEKYSADAAVERCDVVFLALPHTESMNVAARLLAEGKKVIDLSADYRIKKTAVYKKWYHADHKDQKNLSRAVYGLCEIYREKVRKAKLVANPGCYPTAAILGLAPFLSVHSGKVGAIIIDAKSGVSGAGRKVAEPLMFSFVNENFKAYRVLSHQHTPEIAQVASRIAGRDMPVTFVAHLLPVNVGILNTIYLQLTSRVKIEAVAEIYRKFYKSDPFVRVLPAGGQPEIRNVVNTNFCDIGLALSEDGRMLVVTSAIDNLVKGASGQAVQNMNIMNGFPETEGLL
jgi:N-acetyl-gamma-glutamyl-phosphate reductase